MLTIITVRCTIHNTCLLIPSSLNRRRNMPKSFRFAECHSYVILRDIRRKNMVKIYMHHVINTYCLLFLSKIGKIISFNCILQLFAVHLGRGGGCLHEFELQSGSHSFRFCCDRSGSNFMCIQESRLISNSFM